MADNVNFGTVRVVTAASYPCVANDQILACNATGGAITVTLPTLNTAPGRIITAIKTDASANAIGFLAPAGFTIESALSESTLDLKDEQITFVLTGTVWYGATQAEALVMLQATTPGATQTGNINISGTAIAALFSGTTGSVGALKVGTGVIAVSGAVPATLTVIGGDATGGAVTLTLPAATASGRVLMFAKIDASGNQVIIDGSAAETINGSANYQLNFRYESVVITDTTAGNWTINAPGAQVTVQSNTFNGANQLVQMDGGGAYPAASGAAITNVDAVTVGGAAIGGVLAKGVAIDLNVATKQTLYTVPGGKSAVITGVVIRNSAGVPNVLTSVGYGFDVGATNWAAAAVGYDSLTSVTAALHLSQADPLSTGANAIIVGAATNVFGLLAAVVEGAPFVVSVDVMGYLF